MVALPHTDAVGAVAAAERIRAAIEKLEITTATGTPVPVTVSIGVAAFSRGQTLEKIVEHADQAMYAAKAGGRNRIVAGAPRIPRFSRRDIVIFG